MLGLSKIVTGLSSLTGLPGHRATFVLLQIGALPLALAFRTFLHPSRVTSKCRHVAVTLIGLYMAISLYSWSMVHLLILSTVVYIMIMTLQPNVFHYCVFIFSMSYLSLVNLTYQFIDGKTRDLTVTGPMMIMVQKVSSLAFSLHDGFMKDDNSWNSRRKKLACGKMPTVLEYFSYMFYFQGLAVGPFCFYKPYIEFIEGKHILYKPAANGCKGEEKGKSFDSSLTKAVVTKILLGIFMAFLYLTLEHHFPVHSNIDDTIVESSLTYRGLYLWLTVIVVQTKYFYVWVWADAICNASGLGFNGYDDRGEPKWDLVTNVNMFTFMCAMNGKNVLANWNILTTLWLRYVCYDRIPIYRMVMTFLLSCVWHGFYPGYFWTFLSGPCVLEAGKKVRNTIRPYFLTSSSLKFVYDVITWLGTHLSLAYFSIPFTLLRNETIINFYSSFYFSGHIIVLSFILLLPRRKSTVNKVTTNQDIYIDGNVKGTLSRDN
ncbi:membrane-bound glycerophospholipid O-acyltransferase 2-like [Glandiceps talaboti]